MLTAIRRKLGRVIASYLSTPIKHYRPFSTYDLPQLERILQPGDILLVEGNTRISSAIKYLTQSTWSHAAFFAGMASGVTRNGESCPLIEAELREGVIASPISKYQDFNVRICRPVGLGEEDRARVVDFMVSRLGLNYDLKHIFDLLRYLFPTPPIPIRWRRRMIALGSSDPSRAICSSLIAESFQTIRYPILPRIEKKSVADPAREYSAELIYHIRHHSLFTPRDFDVSPYFAVIKPTLESGFDYRSMNLVEDSSLEGPAGSNS